MCFLFSFNSLANNIETNYSLPNNLVPQDNLADNIWANYSLLNYDSATGGLADDDLVPNDLLDDDLVPNDPLADNPVPQDSFPHDLQNRTIALRILRAEYEESVRDYEALLQISTKELAEWDVIVAEKKFHLDQATRLLSWAIKNLPFDSKTLQTINETQRQAWTEWSEAILLREGTALNQAREKMLKCLKKLDQALLVN